MDMREKYCNVPAASKNPLVKEIHFVHGLIDQLKKKTKKLYFHVLLSQYKCPKCSGELTMTDQNRCSCSCGNIFDPTLVFQTSTCCGARLIRRTFHYACSRCKRTNPSRFLFDERLFDRDYFSRMMKASRAKARKKKEEMIRFLAESRSAELPLLQEPCLELVPGLIQDLNDLVGADEIIADNSGFEIDTGFEMDDYRSHILSTLGYGGRMFSSIHCISANPREDRIWRFVTLIFMQHDREIELTQHDNDLLIEKMEG